VTANNKTLVAVLTDFSGKLQNANINAGKQQLNARYAQVTNRSGIIANTSSLNVQGQGKLTGGYLW